MHHDETDPIVPETDVVLDPETGLPVDPETAPEAPVEEETDEDHA